MCSGMRRDLEGERESRDGMTGYGGDGGREGAEMQDGDQQIPEGERRERNRLAATVAETVRFAIPARPVQH